MITNLQNRLSGSPCIMFVQYTGGVQYNGGCSVPWGYHEYSGGCSVHQRETMSTPGVYLDECGDIMRTLGVFSTLGDVMSTPGYVLYTEGYHEYTGGLLSVHWGVFITLEGYHQYTGGLIR